MSEQVLERQIRWLISKFGMTEQRARLLVALAFAVGPQR